jgi:hypothetical protein
MQINSVDSCSHDVVICVYHNAGNVIEVHEKLVSSKSGELTF